MDLFEQWFEQSWQMKLPAKKAIMEEKRAACACSTCPSYNRCAAQSKELVYCITGKSPLCISLDNGCSCRNCSVISDLGLKYHDFCLKGSEAAQRYEHEVH
jgi:hypothetical protein